MNITYKVVIWFHNLAVDVEIKTDLTPRELKNNLEVSPRVLSIEPAEKPPVSAS